ncbi:MAG: hypothetical protein OXC62_09465 [Aestuariivita sp.]|nr:hypothetical protein [Aestuariivita sp.]
MRTSFIIQPPLGDTKQFPLTWVNSNEWYSNSKSLRKIEKMFQK